MRIYKVLLILIIFHTTQSCAPLLGGLGAVAIGGATLAFIMIKKMKNKPNNNDLPNTGVGQ